MRRHTFDLVSLVAGIALAGAGALLIGDQGDLVERLRWTWPLLLTAVALVMLASVALERRKN